MGLAQFALSVSGPGEYTKYTVRSPLFLLLSFSVILYQSFSAWLSHKLIVYYLLIYSAAYPLLYTVW